MDLDGFGAATERTGTLPMRVLGECVAFDNPQLDEKARRDGIGWHLWLLRRVVVGLWQERSRNKAYVCFTLHPGVTCVFFCSRQKRHPERFYDVMSATTAYMETGRDGFPPGQARSLAYWEPPCTAVALWPRGLRGETDGARVVDTGNAMSYFSYPDSDHSRGISVHKAGPDYVRVPQEEHAEFEFDSNVYRYLNRWAAGEMDLRLEF